MLTDETNSNTSTSIESACLPIGCSVSAKYRGAFCSAKVKTVDRQVKLKVTLFNTGDTVIISEEEIVHPVPLCIGNTVLIHTPNAHHSRSGLAALINDNHHNKQQGTIKQIYDNSVYTVVFNDGDEKSLRRSSLCLHGIRLYQTKIGQQKLIEDIPTSSAIPKDQNDMASIVAVCRNGNQAFPALILKRKSLADYIWVKSFLDGREYIVHKRDDVESYKNNSEIQSLCRTTSKQATKACEKFIKYNQIPLVWQKKKKRQHHNDQEHGNDSNTSESDIDDSDNETTEEKDSFVAQLFAFMDDRGTPINNIPKIHNYDLDLHRLFKVVRMFGGFNKVSKNDQWSRVYIKMGLPDEASVKNSRAIEHAYKKYLFAYEDLSKKLGTMNALSAYFGGRTSMGSDSRRSLIRVRQQSEEKKPSLSIKQPRKRLSVDSKPTLSSTKNQTNTTTARRKTIIIKPSISSSESDTSDTETNSNNNNNTNNKIKKNSKKIISTIKKPPTIIADDKKKTAGTKNSSIDLRSNSAPVRKSRSTTESEESLKPVIKIQKISYDVFMESTLGAQRNSKRQTSTSNPSPSDSIKQPLINDLTPLQVTPVSPSPPPSITDESSSISVSVDTPSILQTIIPSSIPNHQLNETENLSTNPNKRSYENCESNKKVDEPSKRSRHSQDSNDKTPQRHNRLTYDDISMNDILLVKFDLNQKKEYHGKCLEKNNMKKQLLIHYQGLDSKYNEWIDLDRVIQRISTEECKSDDSDPGIWKSLLSEDIDSSTTPEKYYPPTENRVLNIEHIIPITSDNLLHSLTVQEEIIDNSSEPSAPCVLSISIPPSPPDNRRTSIRQQQRRTFQHPKDSSGPLKKRARLDFEYNSNFHLDSTTNGDNSPIQIEQESKRCRTVGKRSVKRTVNQQDNEIEDFHLNSPINITLRQQLEDMFKHRSSRYNFLDLNNNLTGDRRLAHLKDRMRQCQKVFFNLKGALTKIEKQRKIFLRRQKLLLPPTTTTDLLLPSTCT